MLDPDRVALFGYAHVPHMAKRQKLIDEAALPGDVDRYRLSAQASGRFRGAGYEAIGIDHFAKPDDSLARAAKDGTIRRNFQGYTTDACPTLIGLGASSISRFGEGYVQNAAATPAYIQRIEAGSLAGYRGHSLHGDDKLRARAIEMLMCNFAIDEDTLWDTFGECAKDLDPIHEKVSAAYAPFVIRTSNGLKILPGGQPLTRIIAQHYDRYVDSAALYSKAS